MFSHPNFHPRPSPNWEELALTQRLNYALPPINHHGLSLRRLEVNDLAIWFDYLRSDLVRSTISWDVKHERELLNFVDHERGNQRKWALVDVHNRLVGTAGFHSFQLAHNACEIAYDIAPEHWGKSYGTALCRALSNWAHTSLNMKRISATVMQSNVGSKRVLEKSGYNFEGILRSYRLVRGSYLDYFLYSSIVP